MNSIVVDKKVLDYNYKKINEFSYAFYIGDIPIGQVYRMRKLYWSCISYSKNNLCPVEGFRSRFYASDFLLKLDGYK